MLDTNTLNLNQLLLPTDRVVLSDVVHHVLHQYPGGITIPVITPLPSGLVGMMGFTWGTKLGETMSN